MKNKRQSGEVVVEASIVVTLTVIIISIMLYVGMVLYQQTLVSVMANQTASNIAQVYSNNLRDPFTGYIDPDQVYQTVTYSNMKTDAYVDVIQQKAHAFAKYRLQSSKILAPKDTSVDVEIVKKPNELLKDQIIVTVRSAYQVPLVGMFGQDGLVSFSASGRADCVDILGYVNGVEAIGDPENSNIGSLPDSRICTVTFVPDRENLTNSTVVTVMNGKNILTSNRYTHCVMPADPKKGDLEFAGWFTDAGNAFSASTTVEGDLIVYGRWMCEVTLDANGGTVNGKSKDTIKVPYGNKTNFPKPTRTGYEYTGWFDTAGNVYQSNDRAITQNITLRTDWKCLHPSRYESKRTGTPCDGGTIEYKCRQCDADLGTGQYEGSGHNCWYRCSVAHTLDCFDGRDEDGGCWGYHKKNTWCSSCGVKHGEHVYYYHVVCEYCAYKEGTFWCGNEHCDYTRNRRPYHPC